MMSWTASLSMPTARRKGAVFVLGCLVATLAMMLAAPAPAAALVSVRITGHPLPVTKSRTARFTFARTPSTATLSCALDSTTYRACSSPKTYTALRNGLHTFRVKAAAGGVSAKKSYTWRVDATPPSLTINAAYQIGIGSGRVFAAGSTVWVNTLSDGMLRLPVTATDTGGSGMAKVTFPDIDGALAANWTPAGGIDTTSPYSFDYTWAADSDVPPAMGYVDASVKVAAADKAGNVTSRSLTVTSDTTAPEDLLASYPDGFTNEPTLTLEFESGSDVGSGLRTWQMQQSVAGLANGECGPFSEWADVGDPDPSSPMLVPLSDGVCYTFQLVSTDNVGNTRTFDSGNIVKADQSPPSDVTADGGSCAWTGTYPLSITPTSMDESSGLAYINYQTSTDGANWGSTAMVGLSAEIWDGGATFVRFSAVDQAGNATEFLQDGCNTTAMIDKVEPTTPTIGSPAAGWHNSAVDLTASSEDYESGIASWQWQSSPTGAAPWTTLPETGNPLTIDSDSDLYYRVSATDGIGYTSGASTPVHVQVDLADPTAAPTGGSATWTSDGVTISANEDDNLSGVSTVSYEVSTDGGGSWDGPTAGNLVPFGPAGGYVADGTYIVRFTVTDNAGNSLTTTPNNDAMAKIDTVEPSGFFTTPGATPLSGTVSITGSVSDETSGLASYEVHYDGPVSGTLAGCTGEFSCPLDTTGLADGEYTFTLAATDNAGLSAPEIDGVIVTIDNGAPSGSFDSFVEGSNPQYQFASGSTMYFNPSFGGDFTVRVNASDAGAGIDYVEFPDLDGPVSLWTPAGSVDTTGPEPYSGMYAWSVGAANPGVQEATVADLLGRTTPVTFSIMADAAYPESADFEYVDGFTNSGSVSVTLGTPDDLGSGVDSWQLMRSEGTLGGGVCAGFGAYAAIGPASPSSPYVDTTIADGKCYMYKLLMTDNVGNSGYATSTSEVKADTTPPDMASASITGGNGGACSEVLVALTAGGAADVASGVDRYEWSYNVNGAGYGSWGPGINSTQIAANPPSGTTLVFRTAAFDAAGNMSLAYDPQNNAATICAP